MSVSAIVVSYRTGAVLDLCLAALAADPEITEVLVVDNGNPPEAERRLDAFAASHAQCRLFRGRGNIGFAAASNWAARGARGSALLFVNPDVVLRKGAASSLYAALKTAPAPSIIGGDLRDLNGDPDRGSRRDKLTMWRAFVSFSGLSRFESSSPLLRDLYRHHDPLPRLPLAVGAVSGALMLMRRTDFEALGGFDEGYFLHVEDLDLCRRAESAGGAVLFQPGPHGVHARSTSAVSSKTIARHKARGFARYFRKHAKSPVERFCADIAGRTLFVLLPLMAKA